MAEMKRVVRGRRLVATLAVLSVIVLVAASCGGGGGSGPVVDPRDPMIPIVPADDHGDTRADATDLALGSSIPGEIEAGDDDDFFRVQVTEAGTLTVYTTGSLDTQGELQASDGSSLANDDDGGDGENFRIEHDVGPGTYYVRVRSIGTDTGRYVVLASFDAEVLPPPLPPDDDHGDTRSDATDLPLGSSVQGEIEEGEDDDFFRVQVTEAGTLTVYTTASLDTQGELQASDGSVLASDDDDGDGLNFRIEHDVGPGTYYARVRSYDAATGSYVVLASFEAEVLPPPLPPDDDHGDTRSDGTDLALGSSVPGEIEEGDDDDFFRVQVTEAGTLTVYTTGSLDTRGELQASDGSILASDDDGGDGENFRIEHGVGPGTYYVRVRSFGTDTGSYVVLATFLTAHMDEPGTPGAAIDITGKDTVTGYIDSAGDIDYFQITLSEPGVIEIEIEAPVGTEISALDETGRILVSGVVPGLPGSQGLGTRSAAPVVPLTTAALGSVRLNPFLWDAAKKLFLKVVAPAGVRAVIGNPYVVAAATVTAAVLYIYFKRNPLKIVPNAEPFRYYIPDQHECHRRNDDRPVENCSIVAAESTGTLTVTTAQGVELSELMIVNNAFFVAVPCGVELAEVEYELSISLGPVKIGPFSGTREFEVQESDDCNDGNGGGGNGGGGSGGYTQKPELSPAPGYCEVIVQEEWNDITSTRGRKYFIGRAKMRGPELADENGRWCWQTSEAYDPAWQQATNSCGSFCKNGRFAGWECNENPPETASCGQR